MFTLYIHFRRQPSPVTVGLAHTNAKERDRRKDNGKERRKKGIEVQRKKPLAPTLAIDALIGEEERLIKIYRAELERRRRPKLRLTE